MTDPGTAEAEEISIASILATEPAETDAGRIAAAADLPVSEVEARLEDMRRKGWLSPGESLSLTESGREVAARME